MTAMLNKRDDILPLAFLRDGKEHVPTTRRYIRFEIHMIQYSWSCKVHTIT